MVHIRQTRLAKLKTKWLFPTYIFQAIKYDFDRKLDSLSIDGKTISYDNDSIGTSSSVRQTPLSPSGLNNRITWEGAAGKTLRRYGQRRVQGEKNILKSTRGPLPDSSLYGAL